MISDICNDITMVSDKVFKAKMQTEREKYYILTHTDSEKNGTDEHICRARLETQALRTDLWILGKGEDGTN